MRKPRRPNFELIETPNWSELRRRRREERETGPRAIIRQRMLPRLREIRERARRGGAP